MRTISRVLQAASLVSVLVCLSASVAEAGQAYTALYWNQNPESDIAGYLLSWGTAPDQYVATIDVGNQVSYLFWGPDPTLKYYFAVRAYNTSGLVSAYSTQVSSTSYFALAITTQPQSQTIGSGYTATLSVDATGTPPPSYQWYVGTAGTTSTPIIGATASSYVTPALTSTTNYWVRVSNGRTVDSNTATVLVTLPRRLPRGDYDGDGKTDLTVYRPSTDTWFTRESSGTSGTFAAFQGGLKGYPEPGDYDGDGKTDVAVYRPDSGGWYILLSSTANATSLVFQWGLPGDVPVPGDFDGDGKSDVAVYRPSNGVWYILQSSTSFTTFVTYRWGMADDVAVPGDYDGDGKTDVAMYRPSNGVWYILQSSTNFTTFVAYQWGLGDDVAVPGDYDGDGKTDLAVWRPSSGTWFIRQSTTKYATSVTYVWGLSGDIPVSGDFDGDGKYDLAVFRPSTGTWFLLMPSANFLTSSFQWGQPGDIPIASGP